MTVPSPFNGLRQLLWVGLVGLQFGLFEAIVLRASGFSLSGREAGEILAAHVLLGMAVGVPALAALAILRAVRPQVAAGRFGRSIPTLWTLLVFLIAEINYRLLPGKLELSSLAGDLAVVGLLWLGGLLWARRTWSTRGDAILLVALLAVNAGAALWTLGAGSDGPRAREARGDRSTDAAPNLVLILIDTLRADHLGIYGYERPTSPRLDELAGSGTVFDRAFTASNWTRPSVASLFTSTLPSRHQAVAMDKAISPSLPLLAETLADGGYQTAFITVGVNIEPQDGYSRGVDEFVSLSSRRMLSRTVPMRKLVFRFLPNAERMLRGGATGAAKDDPAVLTDRALEWLRTTDPERPIFLYAHYMGPHRPYSPTPPYEQAFGGEGNQERLSRPPADQWTAADWLDNDDLEQMIRQYDGEILAHDEHVSRLIDGLRSQGRLENGAIVLTADHGEGFGEHGVWGHSAGQFNEITRVPLIFWKSPGSSDASRVEAPVSLLDVAPTLVDLAGLEIPAEFDGGSLRPWLENRGEGDRIVFTENPERQELTLRNSSWTYIEGDSPTGFRHWLYRADDVRQEHEVSELFPEVVEELRETARARREMDRSRSAGSITIELDEDRLDKLRALGYLD